jgi:F-type H+-transporting ATPase subunit gamma
MSRRRELEARLALFDELGGIMNAMRSFALVELRRLTQREAAQQQSRQTLERAMREMSAALPAAEAIAGDIWIAIGSSRGFCAGLNDDVFRFWQARSHEARGTIAVGERLAALMPEAAIPVPGAVGASDAVATIGRIMDALETARRGAGPHAGLVLCCRDSREVALHRILPLPRAGHGQAGDLPLTNEPAASVALKLAEHYLFHTLLAKLIGALRVENHLRLMQMENARQHIDRASAAQRSRRNQLRQEEIIEEIELIQHAGSRDRHTVFIHRRSS